MDPKLRTGLIGICVSMFALMILAVSMIFSIINNAFTSSTLITDSLLFLSIIAIFLTNLSVVVNTYKVLAIEKNKIQEIKIGNKDEKEIKK
ncbi:MAG: hypothetical protein PHH22_02395 [Clostridia bacterium]|nr:hypothetical protein [Clostridia bacterium]